jgi:hypothetical protein
MKTNGNSKDSGWLGWMGPRARGVPSWVPGAPTPREQRAHKETQTLTDTLRAAVQGNSLAERILAVAMGETTPKASALTEAIDRAMTGKVKALSPGGRKLYNAIQAVVNR